MCCFSRQVELVSNTNIFARSSNQGRQFVVYSMNIHDGKVHPEADFDHSMYCQAVTGETLPMNEWVESVLLASQFLKVNKTEGIVDGDSHVHVRAIRGKRKNEDILV